MQITHTTARLAQYKVTIIPMAWSSPADRGFLSDYSLDNLDLEAELLLDLTATEIEVGV